MVALVLDQRIHFGAAANAHEKKGCRRSPCMTCQPTAENDDATTSSCIMPILVRNCPSSSSDHWTAVSSIVVLCCRSLCPAISSVTAASSFLVHACVTTSSWCRRSSSASREVPEREDHARVHRDALPVAVYRAARERRRLHDPLRASTPSPVLKPEHVVAR